MLITEDNIREISKIGHAERIVSLVPSLTETIASLGAKSTLAGVPRFCKYPDRKVLLVDGEMFSWYGSRMLKVGEYFKKLRHRL